MRKENRQDKILMFTFKRYKKIKNKIIEGKKGLTPNFID